MGIKRIIMKLNRIWITLLVIAFAHHGMAQAKRYQIGMFLPLYLDSAFDATDAYRYGKGFPRQSISGLEFYLGAGYALDSLSSEGRNLRVHIFDTRSSSGSISSPSVKHMIDSLDLIIGSASGNEFLQLSALAQQKKIPFVSATYPNDGGIRNNPYLIIANPKLNTHLQATYNYILRNLGTSRIIYARRKNAADDRVADVFKELNRGTAGPVVKMETIFLNDAVVPTDLVSSLDSVRQNVIIAGSVDENFGRNLAVAALANAKTFPITMVGMPTWEGIRDLQKNEFRPLPIIYSNSFFNSGEGWSQAFEDAYKKKSFSRPSDIAYKGYELTWYFSCLLFKYQGEIMSHLEDNECNLLTDYDFKPIQFNKGSTGPDYFENKRVFMVKRLNGVTTRVN
jgi:ABC-type branched-subunit amino acid transport system substrate-binding protein